MKEESGYYTGQNAASAPYCSQDEDSYESPHPKRAMSITSDQELDLNSRGSWFNPWNAEVTSPTSPEVAKHKPRTRSRRVVKKEVSKI